MLDDHLSSPITRQRRRSGPAAEYVDHFADWLHCRRYRPATITDLLYPLASWTDWMRAAGFTAHDVLPAFEACKMRVESQRRHARYQRGVNRRSLTAASLYIRFLQERGVVPPSITAPAPSDRWPILGAFRSWMCQHRGLTERTLDAYQGVLLGLIERLGEDPSRYTAEALRAFVFERAQPHGIHRAKSIVVAVRALLRFLGATGQCPQGMEYAIPGFASWQVSSVPRFLVPDDVQRVIDSCGDDATGRRDKAVLLLLARLGLVRAKWRDWSWPIWTGSTGESRSVGRDVARSGSRFRMKWAWPFSGICTKDHHCRLRRCSQWYWHRFVR